MTTKQTFVAVRVQVEGDLTDWRIAYYVDGRRPFSSRQLAIANAVDELGHDDFLLAVLEGGDTLVGIAWQFEDKDVDGEWAADFHKMAEQCGWHLPETRAGGRP